MSTTSRAANLPLARRPGRVTQVRVVLSEWTKLRSVRSTRYSLLTAVVFTIGQDYTFTVGANTSFNFSNSLSLAGVPAVPEPGSFLAGASVLGLIGGSQLLRRKRNREVAC